ncbi:MAG: type II toxin-antitoxin system VapC family toxin [Hydrogenophaga sp.]|uniref:type II toxin-antitoxin system VapC family toxin n=1 Tax=Hydrogenophaga sp. TaxID=1904254 RepID=UPI0027351F60|nr:type II toxin-antitoxin system VapC family toxin [Hydrogenophaga sp.]MDP3343583.1 type II toxin-antitoxin system VapC family toxin [Hydrogenophaga sp.]MDP3807984.1 type II toxin-antitoxin system VapC family toxin [Hydrogenophaga sp.]MDP3925516.1 type II toxin-antitoxin system VapC family toxin [Hydrogenophaga sp.]
MTSFVLDNSVVCGWLLESQSTPYSEAVAQRLRTSRAMAPALLPLEYTNVLRTACKRQNLVAAQAQHMLALLAQLPIDIDTTAPNPAQVFDLALRHDLTSYDALYLDLALRHSLPIATQDRALANAALAAGVGLVSA